MTEFSALTRSALAVVISAAPRELNDGLKTEIKMVAEEIGHERIVLLLGPVRRPKVALRRWRSFYDEAAQFPVFSGSARAVGPASAQVAVHLGSGRWRGWGSAARTEASYVVSTLTAMEAAVTHWAGAPPGPALVETASPLRAWAADWLAHLVASGGVHGPGSRRTIKITDSAFSYLFPGDEIGDHLADRPGSDSSRRAVTHEGGWLGVPALWIEAVAYTAGCARERIVLVQPYRKKPLGRTVAEGAIVGVDPGARARDSGSITSSGS